MAITDQTEIKKVINIEAGNSLTILKDYKRYIDELKKSLDDLDESSDEYKQTVNDIEKAEDRLNSMMRVNSNELLEANKKYEDLIGTLQDLEDQLKDVNNAGDKLDIKDKIADVTDNIKDLVDETANSSENIDNLGDSGVTAFGNLLESADGINGSLGVLNGNLGDTVRAIFQCGKAAMTAGTEAATAEALASGGLTLIISALVLIIAYWDEISNFLDESMDKLEELTGTQNSYKRAVEETEQSIADMNARLDESNEKLDFQLRLMRAQGATALEVSRAELSALNKQKNEILNQLSQGYSVGITEEQEQQLLDRLNSVKDRIKKTNEDIIIDQARVDAQNRARQEAEQSNLKTHNSNISNINKEHYDREEEQRNREVQQILDRLHKANTDEITLLDEKYNKEKELLESAGKDTVQLTEEYEQKRLEAMQKAAEKQQEQAKANLKEQTDQLKEAKDQDLYELQFQDFEGTPLEQEKAQLDAKWEIEQEYYLKRIELQQEYLDMFVGSIDQEKIAEEELDKLRQELSNRKMKYDNDAAKNSKKQADEEKKYKEKALMASLNIAGDVFGALGDLASENSEEQKLFNIMETTISTLTGAINAYKSMAGIPVVGPALGAAAAAAVTAAGIANINKIKSTTKDNATALGSSASEQSSLSMTSVSPLLNEESDLQRLTMLSEQGDSNREMQNVRVYVVDQDIRDANRKAEVVENNATF